MARYRTGNSTYQGHPQRQLAGAIAVAMAIVLCSGRAPAAARMLRGVAGYPRLANLDAFTSTGQIPAFARYSMIVAPAGAAHGRPSALAQLRARYPMTTVLFYMSLQNVALPSFSGYDIYPGWWLTYAGSTLVGDISADQTGIAVASAAMFVVGEVALVDGENMPIKGVDTLHNILTVTRGYLSSARAHSAGTRIAGHVTLDHNATWWLNASSTCPTNPAGETWSDYLVRQAAHIYRTAPWSGVFFDWTNTDISYHAPTADANNDNFPDGANGPSGTGWRDGMTAAIREARTRLGARAIIMGNGGYYEPYSNGTEFEHFPYFDHGWQAAFPFYTAMAAHGAYSVIDADTDNTGKPDLQVMRYGLATALMANGYYAYDGGHSTHGQTWQFDEYDGGVGSSLVRRVDARATTLVLAPRTGRTFRAGDVVFVAGNPTSGPLSGYTDEQMRVLRVVGDTLVVRRGAGRTRAASHPAGFKVFTAAQLARGMGWLGQPVTAAQSLTLRSANQLTSGLFERTGQLWLYPWSFRLWSPAAATIEQDADHVSGSYSARIETTSAVPLEPWFAALTQRGLYASKGTTYTLTFYARSNVPAGSRITAALHQVLYPYALGGKQLFYVTDSWQRYTLTFEASTTEELALEFDLAATPGTVWIDDARFQAGDPNVWRRDFTNGIVLLNQTAATQRVALGGVFHHIRGTQDPTLNDGAAVTSVTIPPQDGVLLRR